VTARERFTRAALALRAEVVTTDCGAFIDRPEYGEAAALEFDAAKEALEREERSTRREMTSQQSG